MSISILGYKNLNSAALKEYSKHDEAGYEDGGASDHKYEGDITEVERRLLSHVLAVRGGEEGQALPGVPPYPRPEHHQQAEHHQDEGGGSEVVVHDVPLVLSEECLQPGHSPKVDVGGLPRLLAPVVRQVLPPVGRPSPQLPLVVPTGRGADGLIPQVGDQM